MSSGTKVFFSPKHPVIWFAEYSPNIKELKIPKCLECNSLIQVSQYDNIICNKCGGSNITWSVDAGAKNILINRVLLEFDENGNEMLNYKDIPLDGLLRFGLLDPSTFVAYGIELLTGYITISDFRSAEQPFYLATGINANVNTSNLIKISDAIINKTAKLKLQHGKQMICGGAIRISMINFETISNLNMDPHSLQMDNVYVGYTCEMPGWDFEVIIRIDCNNHLPYFTSKATQKEGDISEIEE